MRFLLFLESFLNKYDAFAEYLENDVANEPNQNFNENSHKIEIVRRRNVHLHHNHRLGLENVRKFQSFGDITTVEVDDVIETADVFIFHREEASIGRAPEIGKDKEVIKEFTFD
jgi:hypothetical protein